MLLNFYPIIIIMMLVVVKNKLLLSIITGDIILWSCPLLLTVTRSCLYLCQLYLLRELASIEFEASWLAIEYNQQVVDLTSVCLSPQFITNITVGKTAR